jgi:pyruvate dehydrogenase E2 component (dihydrolipoyllysine-residue acetyltransferase)
MGEVDMTEMIRLRETLLQREADLGVRIAYTDLFVLVLAKAVQQVPIVNSSLVGDQIVIWEDINVGVAVALDLGQYESGLIVPVVQQADRKSLVQISHAVGELTQRAKKGKLEPEDVSGGTITLSNAGAYYPGWVVTTPILNQPQAMIVQPGGIFDKPIARDGQVVVRPVMTLSLTYDHRILDGVPVARFYTRLQELIEQPAFLLL